MTPEPLETCSVCGLGLDPDNHYGDDDLPLCRECYDVFCLAVQFMADSTNGGEDVDYD